MEPDTWLKKKKGRLEHGEKVKHMHIWASQFKEKEDKADIYLNIHYKLHI